MKPNKKEIKALQQFVSQDPTRPHLSTIWEYEDSSGCTHVATDGHTIVLRRAGAHVQLTLHDIIRLAPKALSEGEHNTPSRWDFIVKAPNCEGANALVRGINPAYFARVSLVERAAGLRAAKDYVPSLGQSKGVEKLKRRSLIDKALSVWRIGIDPLDGWYWTICGKILWEGVIMPRRV